MLKLQGSYFFVVAESSAFFMGLAWSYGILCMGRFICGLGIGMASAIIPVYLSECAPPEIRGQVIALYNMNITFGNFMYNLTVGCV